MANDDKRNDISIDIGARSNKKQMLRETMGALKYINGLQTRIAKEAKNSSFLNSTQSNNVFANAKIIDNDASYKNYATVESVTGGQAYGKYLNNVVNIFNKLLKPTDAVGASLKFINEELNKELKLIKETEGQDFGIGNADFYRTNIEQIEPIKEKLLLQKQELENIEKLRKATKSQGKELSENEKLLKEFNENFNITGIVGIYAFRRISRYGRVLLKSLIELTIENQKLENGFSSLNNKIETFNSRVTSIKSNLGSSIASVLEPLMNVLNIVTSYIASFTKGLAELPFPLKQMLGLLSTALIIIPSVISLVMVLRYYLSKVVKTLLQQASAGSKVTAWLVKYRSQISSTIGYLSIAVILALSLYNLFRKTNKENAKANKNIGIASFDDVNTLGDKTTAEIEEITEKTEKLHKVISAIIAALSIGVLLVRIFGKTFGFAGFEAVKSLFQVFTNPALLASVAAIGTVILGVAHVIQKLISGVQKLVAGWSQLSFLEKSVSIFLMVASAVWTLAGAIIAVKGALKGNWLQFGLGALVVGGGIGLGYGANAYIDSKLPKAAHGGVTKGATVAMVGEGKYQEVIMPLGNSPEFSAMKEDITNAVLAGLSVQGGKSDQPINLYITVDEDFIYRSYNKVAKKNGR